MLSEDRWGARRSRIGRNRAPREHGSRWRAGSITTNNIAARVGPACQKERCVELTGSSLLDPDPLSCAGIAREFEIVDKPQKVIMLEEDIPGYPESDEEWEQIYRHDLDHDTEEPPRTYSAVVQDSGQNFKQP